MARNLSLVDGVTGQTFDEVPVVFASRKKTCFNRPFGILFLDGLDFIVRNRARFPSDAKDVLMHLICESVYNNAWQPASQSAIGKYIGIRRERVNRAIAVLVRERFLLRKKNPRGRGYLYMVNSLLMFRGDSEKYGESARVMPSLGE